MITDTSLGELQLFPIFTVRNNGRKVTKEDCIILIKNKFNENNELPKKSDFTDWQVMMIKSHLGPWPRALEKAGVKPPRDDKKLLEKQEKRKRAKERKAQYKKNCEKNNEE